MMQYIYGILKRYIANYTKTHIFCRKKSHSLYLMENMLQALRNIIVVLLLFTTVLFTQENYENNVYSVNTSRSSITGTVLPISSGVDVQLYDTSMLKKTTTNKDGAFFFENLNSGEYIINISKPGYYDHPVAVSIKENKSNKIGEQHLLLYTAKNDLILVDKNMKEDGEIVVPPEIDNQYSEILEYKVLTVCEYLKMRAVQPLAYVQIGVIIIGNMVQTQKGSFLQQSCGNPIKSGTHRWPDAIFMDEMDNMSAGSPSEGVREANRNRYISFLKAAENLRGKDFIKNNSNGAGIAVAVIGRLITSDNLIYINCGEEKTCGFGYGSITAPAQITYWLIHHLNQQDSNED